MKTLITILSIPDLRKKIFFTLFVLLIFRIGAHITVPGVNFTALEEYFASTSSGGSRGITDYIDLFAGGAFKRISLFALGIMPYISASIIMQLLMVVIPSLQKIQKEGEAGRKKITQYIRYATVVLCLAQSYGITVYIKSLHNSALQKSSALSIIDGGPSLSFVLMTMLAITTGTIVLMWLGELITEKGIGNGISILIFVGIIAGAPGPLTQFFTDVQTNQIEVILPLILFFVLIAMIALSVLLTEGTRKIPVQYSKRMVGRRMVQGASQTLPIKVNAANVMPIIFASALMLFPTQIASYLETSYPSVVEFLTTWLTPGNIAYFLIYVILIIFFAYFYTALQYNPKEIAETLKKNGGYIQGIRPGIETEEKIHFILNRITLSGAIFLAFIAIAPDIMIELWGLQKYRNMAYLFGGTSLLIIVGVTLDTLKQIESQLTMRHYEGFFDKSNKNASRSKLRLIR